MREKADLPFFRRRVTVPFRYKLAGNIRRSRQYARLEERRQSGRQNWEKD